jgi:hypothetical protein
VKANALMLKGADRLDAVQVWVGPKGHQRRSILRPTKNHQMVSRLPKAIDFKCKFENMGAQLLRQVTTPTMWPEMGPTSATVLTDIYAEGLNPLLLE